MKKAFWSWAMFWLVDVSIVFSLLSSVSAEVIREVPEQSRAELDEVEDGRYVNDCPQDHPHLWCDS